MHSLLCIIVPVAQNTGKVKNTNSDTPGVVPCQERLFPVLEGGGAEGYAAKRP